MPQEISKDTTSAQNTQSFQQLFDEALAFQQQKNWDASFTAYQKLLAESRNSITSAEASVIYNNLSVVAYEKGDLTKAAIWAKKAVALNSNNQQAQLSMEFYAKKVETPSIAHQISNYDNIKKVISGAPMDLYFILSLVLIFTSLALYLKNIFGLKKNRLNNDFTTPSKWSFICTMFIAILVISITYIRYNTFSVTKALVLNEATKIQTAAGENKPIIFEAPACLELEVLNFEQGYYQVKYPGAFTGWTEATNIELLSLGFEQK